MASGVGESRSRGGQQRGDWEVGDWVCPSCRAINFKRRSSCLKCGVGKPEAFEQAVPYAPLGDGKKAATKKAGVKGDEMWCELCLIECPGQASYTEHCKGKKHRAALRGNQETATVTPVVPSNVSKPSEGGKGDEWSIAVKKSSGGNKTTGAAAKQADRGGQGNASLSSKHQEQHRSNTQPGEWEQGDWVCSACRWINFKKRDTCLKCQNFVNQDNFEQATPYVQPGESKKHLGCMGTSAVTAVALNSKERPRWCELCKVECPGEVSFNEHCAGKKHLAKARQSRQPVQGRAGTGRKADELAIALPRPRDAAWDAQHGRPASEQPYKLEAQGEPPAPLLGGLVSKKKTFAEALSGGSRAASMPAAPESPAVGSPAQGGSAPASPKDNLQEPAQQLGAFSGFAIDQPATGSESEPWAVRGSALWGLPEQPAELGSDLWAGAGLANLGVDGIPAAVGAAPGSPSTLQPVAWQSEMGGSPKAEKPQEADNIWKSASDNSVAWGATAYTQQQPQQPQQQPEDRYEESGEAQEQPQQPQQLSEQMQQVTLQEPQGGAGMWNAGAQSWDNGKGGSNGHGQADDRGGIWDPTQHFGAAPTVNTGPGSGQVVSWDHQLGYAQTREGFLVLVSVYDVANGAIPQQGQQVRWQSLQQDSSGQGYRAVNVELLSMSEYQPSGQWSGQNPMPEQYERSSEDMGWGNGSQQQQQQQQPGFGQQFMPDYKQSYGQHVYQHQVHQMGYGQQGGWGSQGNSWAQQGYSQPHTGYNRGASFGVGSYWGGQQGPAQGANQGMPTNGMKMGSQGPGQQFGQASSVWSQLPNNSHNGMDQHTTTMSWGGAGR